MERRETSIAIVLVHGELVDGSSWESVYDLLRRDGYKAAVVQNATTSLAGDVEATLRVVAAQERRVVLVGHSYGGVVITEAGNHPSVAGLVFVAALVPDEGESAARLFESLPPAKERYVVLDEATFPALFAADVEPRKAAFMAASQVPWGVAALHGTVGEPAWRTKPSWYLVATADRLILPACQRSMAERARSQAIEAAGSHAICISQPIVVAALIDKAATEVA